MVVGYLNFYLNKTYNIDMFSSTISSRMLAKRTKTKVPHIQEEEMNPLEELKSLMQKPDTEKDKNHLYFYTDVTQESCLDLNRKINDLTKELLKHAIEYDCPPPSIFLHINSLGGDLLSGFSVVDTIKNSRVPIVSIIEGNAASAATIISMVCHKRYITKHSFMLIHQLSSACAGTFQQIQDDFQNDTKFMNVLYTLYKEHTTMSDKKIQDVLKHDIWWSSSECIENGLVDGLWNSNTTSLSITNHCTPYHFSTTAIADSTSVPNTNDTKEQGEKSENTQSTKRPRRCKK
jgi:ATP-dependent Clp protease protease subunit